MSLAGGRGSGLALAAEALAGINPTLYVPKAMGPPILAPSICSLHYLGRRFFFWLRRTDEAFFSKKKFRLLFFEKSESEFNYWRQLPPNKKTCPRALHKTWYPYILLTELCKPSLVLTVLTVLNSTCLATLQIHIPPRAPPCSRKMSWPRRTHWPLKLDYICCDLAVQICSIPSSPRLFSSSGI
jgi:hypothetical protein